MTSGTSRERIPSVMPLNNGENPSDRNSDKLSFPRRVVIGALAVGAATGSALGLTGCYPTSAQGNEATPTASAPETPSAEPTSEPSETQAPTETATPTETESPSPEANPFITERFKELDAMTLEEFEEQPREDRAAYMAAFMYKFSDPEWTNAVTKQYSDSNPMLGISTINNTDSEIAHQQFFKEKIAGAVEYIDSNNEDYGREYNKEAGEKLVAAQFYFSPSEMDEETRVTYEKQLERVKESFDDDASGISGDITVKEYNHSATRKLNGEEQPVRRFAMRIDNPYENTKWANELEVTYVTDTIGEKPVGQWMIVKALTIATNLVPIEK